VSSCRHGSTAAIAPAQRHESLAMKRGSPLRILVQNFVFCTGIALVLWQMVPSIGQYGFFANFVHAQAIGNSITLLAMLFSRLATALGYSNRRANFLSIAAATLLGIFIGLWLAATLLGLNNGPFGFLSDADNLQVSAITAVLASLAFNWHLNRREKLIRLELTASQERHRADNAHHAMLRAQLDPHMLFNTLANLRALIGHDNDQALDMLDRLDSFLRETLKSSRSTHHTLAQEVKILDDYLSLMKVRLQERLSYTFAIPQACNDIQVPALLLQPLVENAIRHGIEPQVDGGHITISATLEHSELTLVVEDSGVGMTSYTNEYTPVAVDDYDDAMTEGFGLENLRRRLGQAGGSNASLALAPAHDTATGTRVTIQLPASDSPDSSQAPSAN